MATLSSSNVAAFPRHLHAGLFACEFQFNYEGRSVSAGDILVLGYLQPGVRIVGAQIWGADAGGGSTWDIGTIATQSAIGKAATLSASLVNVLGFLPQAVPSLSADAEGNLKVPIIAKKLTGTTTVTGSLNLTLLCQAPGR